MALRFAYNTNGTVYHRMEDAVALISDAGYDGVALTIDHGALDPMAAGWEARTERLAGDLARRGMGSVIETGARFLLDPRRCHWPTMTSPTREERAVRVAFLQRAIDVGAMLGSEAVSFWSGRVAADVGASQAGLWLRECLPAVLEHAERRGVAAAMEPEPELLVETLDDWRMLAAEFPSLRLALDLGHVMVTGERVPEAAVGEFAASIATVSFEDMKRGRHVHLAFGEGDMDLHACLRALEAIGFSNLVCVELSSDSHRADQMVPWARQWLRDVRA
jgi:sugar phosphate isomerase/epimerase